MLEIIGELVLELAVPDGRPTSTVAKRVSGLDHKLRNHAVEDDTLVVATARMTDEVLHRFWCLLREEPDVNVAERGVDRRRVGDRRRPGLLRRRRGYYQLFFASRPLVEDITVARFIPAKLG